ncbi:MAG: arsenical efflux pump membrane protein ArsB [Candidatus Thorarchaeota archaeon]|nr:MAG: arsenical efflux pump membrane protein ArsB [Candidatus Thorarchaeota archaeon]
MDYAAITSVAVFLVTLFLMVKRPRHINLGIAAGIGAVASLLLGTVTAADAIVAFGNIWDAALAFVGIVMLSVTLDAMGFFRWAALRVARLAHGHGVRLFFYISLFTAAVSILFANDSAVLILTPIVMEMVKELKTSKESSLAYLFGAGLIADTAAMPLITSNPVNIVSADYFGYTFIEHAIFMGLVGIVTAVQTILVVYLFFRKRIPPTYSNSAVEDLIKNSSPPLMLRTSIITLIAIDIGYVVTSLNRIPVSFVIFSGAIFLLTLYAMKYKTDPSLGTQSNGPLQVLRRVNWDILFFMVAIFLVVQGLRHAGAVDFFAALFIGSVSLPSVLSILVPSLIVTIGASAMNNWPMTMLGLLSVDKAMVLAGLGPQASTSLIFANIIGNNLGPHFFPLGSLAILMWLGTMKRKGLEIGLKEYLKIGSILSLLEVTTASTILWLEQTFLHIALTIVP